MVSFPPQSAVQSRSAAREGGAAPSSAVPVVGVCVINSTPAPLPSIWTIGAGSTGVDRHRGPSNLVKRDYPRARPVSWPVVRAVTLDDVARMPRPGTTAPEHVSFSPDGRTLTFLAPPPGTASLARVLWSHDLETGTQDVLFSPRGEGVTEAAVSQEE